MIEKKCFPLFMSKAEILPFLQYYEQKMRPKMHNFLELEITGTSADHFSDYKSVNKLIAKECFNVKKIYPNLKIVWVHGDHLMLFPKYLRNLGF